MRQGSAEWLAARAECAVTHSRLADAVGVGYNSRIAYMREKLGLVPPVEATWRMREGQRKENWVCELYYRYMRAIGRPVTLWVDGFRRDWQDDRIGGSVDRLVTDDATGEEWVLECKTTPGGDLRYAVPVSHNLQMLGLCHTYRCNKAHYICWSEGQGIFLAEVTWQPRLWSDWIYPRVAEFSDMVASKTLPPRMGAGEKEDLIGEIERLTTVREISFSDSTAPQQ